jgi:hypothetical protein
MARNRGKKALYEVMSKARVKPEQGKIVEHPKPQKPVEVKEVPVIRHKEPAGVLKSTAKWWRKPRIVQLNAGRIEFSMPYQIAVALLLVFIFVIIAAFRLGQSSKPAGRNPMGQLGKVTTEIIGEKPTEQARGNVPKPATPPENAVTKTETAEPAKPKGSNVIVLVQYDSLPDLAPVQAHFSEYGIETEIVAEKGHYFLQTKERYDNPDKPGTDGYKAKQKIIEVGAKYKGKAPAGYETFAPNYFSDAYGKSVN